MCATLLSCVEYSVKLKSDYLQSIFNSNVDHDGCQTTVQYEAVLLSDDVVLIALFFTLTQQVTKMMAAGNFRSLSNERP